MLAASGKSEFQKHIIIRVCEKWPPKEMNFNRMRLRRKVSQELQRALRGLAWWDVFGPAEHLLPFQIQRERQANLKLREGIWLINAKLAPVRERAAATRTLVSMTTFTRRCGTMQSTQAKLKIISGFCANRARRMRPAGPRAQAASPSSSPSRSPHCAIAPRRPRWC